MNLFIRLGLRESAGCGWLWRAGRRARGSSGASVGCATFLSWALARSPGARSFGVRPVGVFLRLRACSCPCTGLIACVGALVALVGQRRSGPAAARARGQDAPDPVGRQVVHRAGQRPGDPQDAAVGAGDDLQVHAVLACACRSRTAGRRPPGRSGSASRRGRRRRTAGFFASRSGLAQPRRAGCQQRNGLVRRISRLWWCRLPNPAARSANVSPLRR